MTRNPTLVALTALALTVGFAMADEPPSAGDIIFTPGAGEKPAVSSSQRFDLEKCDYVLSTDPGGSCFDDLHSRTMTALAAESSAGNALASEAATVLAALKVTADTAYEEFLAALVVVKKELGYDVLASGAAALGDRIAGLEGAAAVRARELQLAAGRKAGHVIASRAVYRRRATELAAKVLAAK